MTTKIKQFDLIDDKLFKMVRSKSTFDEDIRELIRDILDASKENNAQGVIDSLNVAETLFPSFSKQMPDIIKQIKLDNPNPSFNKDFDSLLNEQKMFEKIQKQKQTEQKNEIKDLKKLHPVSDRSRHSAVRDLFRDKNIAAQSDFKGKGTKEAGVSAGYVAKEKETGHTFMLKQFYLKQTDCKNPQDLDNRRDGVNELIFADLYKSILYDRAPKEELVKPDSKHKNSIYVRSKFLDDSITLDKFSGAPNTQLKPFNPQLKKLEGFEKFIAGCNMLGEIDYHAGNAMVLSQKQNDGTTKNIIAKIDHGRSGMSFSSSAAAHLTNLYNNFKMLGYQNAINAGNLNFSPKEYSESLKQMLEQINESSIDNIVDNKIAKLQSAGFDPKGIQTGYILDNDFKNPKNVGIIQNFKDLGDRYKILLKNNLQTMRELSSNMEIIAKYSNLIPEYANGKWLQAMACSPIKDPVLFAHVNNILIDGKPAIEWGVENQHKVNINNKQWDVAELLLATKMQYGENYLRPNETEFFQNMVDNEQKNSYGVKYQDILNNYGLKFEPRIKPSLNPDLNIKTDRDHSDVPRSEIKQTVETGQSEIVADMVSNFLRNNLPNNGVVNKTPPLPDSETRRPETKPQVQEPKAAPQPQAQQPSQTTPKMPDLGVKANRDPSVMRRPEPRPQVQQPKAAPQPQAQQPSQTILKMPDLGVKANRDPSAMRRPEPRPQVQEPKAAPQPQAQQPNKSKAKKVEIGINKQDPYKIIAKVNGEQIDPDRIRYVLNQSDIKPKKFAATMEKFSKSPEFSKLNPDQIFEAVVKKINPDAKGLDTQKLLNGPVIISGPQIVSSKTEVKALLINGNPVNIDQVNAKLKQTNTKVEDFTKSLKTLHSQGVMHFEPIDKILDRAYEMSKPKEQEKSKSKESKSKPTLERQETVYSQMPAAPEPGPQVQQPKEPIMGKLPDLVNQSNQKQPEVTQTLATKPHMVNFSDLVKEFNQKQLTTPQPQAQAPAAKNPIQKPQPPQMPKPASPEMAAKLNEMAGFSALKGVTVENASGVSAPKPTPAGKPIAPNKGPSI